jgi:glycosyltransferase involved in cell wall biosynthesis
MRIAYLTAGAAGMYCGSCLHDNALARAFHSIGLDCTLIPVYTPIRTDEPDFSSAPVFLGGINVYLEQKIPLWGRLPHQLTDWLDRPSVLQFAMRRQTRIDPRFLGGLTVSLLKGRAGRQRREIDRLVDWLADELRPDLVVFTNFLIGGAIPAIRQRLKVPVVVTLQGDDIFLDHLPPPYQEQALKELRRLVPECAAFLTNTQFYARKMGQLLGISAERIHVEPLSIDTEPYARLDPPPHLSNNPPRIGYFARIAPEKGLHYLIDAYLLLAQQPEFRSLELHVGGWLGEQNQSWFHSQWDRLRQAGLSDRCVHHGSPDLAGKISFLQSVDVVCVPTEYEDPKGLFALESLAAGTPVVLHAHGGFPELLADLEGGVLVPPRDQPALTKALAAIVSDRPRARQIGEQGRRSVFAERTVTRSAQRLAEYFRSLGVPR